MARVRCLGCKKRVDACSCRSPDLWEVTVSAGRDPVTGRYRQVSRTVHGGRRAAQAAAADLVTKVGSGRHKGTNRTLAYLLDEWLGHLEALGRAPKTMYGYESLTRTVKAELGDVRLVRLTAADLDGYYRRLLERGLSPATVHHYHAMLRTALNQAVRWEWIDRSPADHASPPALTRPAVQAPTSSDVQRLAAAVETANPQLAAFIFLAATTGCRRGELCGLQWGDIFAEEGFVIVSRSVSNVAGSVSVKGTKTNRARRLALDPASLLVLATQRARAAQHCAAAGVDLGDECFVFSYEPDYRSPCRPDSIGQSFQRLRDRLGLTHVRLHHLRHFAATMMLAGGVDVRTTAGRLGHSQPHLTLGTYGHLVRSQDEAAAALLGRILTPSGAGDTDT